MTNQGSNHTNARAAIRGTRPGFSLLEIMLVVAIIGILMGAVAWNLAGAAARAKISATKMKMRTIKGALTQYSLDYSVYPPTLQPLVVLKVIEGTAIKDDWGRDFYYNPQGLATNPFELISVGDDGQPNTGDDLDVWKMDIK